jgi:hypothetical protein
MAKYYYPSRYHVEFRYPVRRSVVRQALARNIWMCRETVREKYPQAETVIRNRIVRATVRKSWEQWGMLRHI